MWGGGGVGAQQTTVQVDSHIVANLTASLAELNGCMKRGAPTVRLSRSLQASSPRPITDLPHQEFPTAANNFFLFIFWRKTHITDSVKVKVVASSRLEQGVPFIVTPIPPPLLLPLSSSSPSLPPSLPPHPLPCAPCLSFPL